MKENYYEIHCDVFNKNDLKTRFEAFRIFASSQEKAIKKAKKFIRSGDQEIVKIGGLFKITQSILDIEEKERKNLENWNKILLES